MLPNYKNTETDQPLNNITLEYAQRRVDHKRKEGDGEVINLQIKKLTNLKLFGKIIE